MAQTNFTPILTYKSDTASAVPSAGNLTNSANGAELAVNTADKRLFTKDSGGSVVELGTNPSSLTLPNGTANGVVYANGSKVLTTGSALTFDGTTLNFGSTGQRITGDMSNATQLNRLFFQNSIANSNTSIGVMPNGTATSARVNVFNSSAPDNAAYLQLAVDGGAAYLQSSATGSGTALPMSFIAGGSTRYQIQTSGESVWSIGSEQMRLTSTGLGIGTSSPTDSQGFGKALDISSASYGGALYIRSSASASTFAYLGYDYTALAATLAAYGTSTKLQFATGTGAGAVKMTLDSSGNLGLGVTPSAWSGGGQIDMGSDKFISSSDPYLSIGTNVYYSGGYKYKGTGAATYLYQTAGQFKFFQAASGTAGNAITFTQALTLDADGNLIAGKTSTAIGTAGVVVTYYGTLQSSTATGDYSIFNKTTTSTGKQMEFRSANTAVGDITCSSTATTYNTSSDYRLKENVQPMIGALAKVAALKPCTYKWKADGSDGEGFIAHELAEVVPQCVTGEKDAVDAEGNPQYQGIDTSFLVATLTAAIQELKAQNDELRARVAALEAK